MKSTKNEDSKFAITATIKTIGAPNVVETSAKKQNNTLTSA